MRGKFISDLKNNKYLIMKARKIEDKAAWFCWEFDFSICVQDRRLASCKNSGTRERRIYKERRGK